MNRFMNCNSGCMNNCMPPMNGMCPEPIIANKRVCVTRSSRYIEQPVICPIECRHVQNIVYYPRYYPRYEQTFVMQGPNGETIQTQNGQNNPNQECNGNGFESMCNCK